MQTNIPSSDALLCSTGTFDGWPWVAADEDFCEVAWALGDALDEVVTVLELEALATPLDVVLGGVLVLALVELAGEIFEELVEYEEDGLLDEDVRISGG
jgi:hypothetical protein